LGYLRSKGLKPGTERWMVSRAIELRRAALG
jgi:hypothetical protein